MKHSSKFDMETADQGNLPNWVPEDARAYLEHTQKGRSIRAVAREKGGHASTISRHVQRLEAKRDDPLVDAALDALETCHAPDVKNAADDCTANRGPLKDSPRQPPAIVSDSELNAEAKRVLRRLCETDAFLIVATSMEKAAVMRKGLENKPSRVAVVDRHVVQAFALKDWIECFRKGKITSYRITNAGKAALKRLLARDQPLEPGFAEAQNPFQEQHKNWGEKQVQDRPGERPKRVRYNLSESPLTALGRRKGSDGQPFLTQDLIQAGEYLREDFEMAQMGPRVTQNWDRFLTMGRSGGINGDAGPAEGPRAARERVAKALKNLGPGLGDIALRCCCFLEGLETAEKRMGWSARSGKIVLRIALQRLKLHYDFENGNQSPPMG